MISNIGSSIGPRRSAVNRDHRPPAVPGEQHRRLPGLLARLLTLAGRDAAPPAPRRGHPVEQHLHPAAPPCTARIPPPPDQRPRTSPPAHPDPLPPREHDQ